MHFSQTICSASKFGLQVQGWTLKFKKHDFGIHATVCASVSKYWEVDVRTLKLNNSSELNFKKWAFVLYQYYDICT